MYNIFPKNLFLRVVLIASLISFLWLSGIQKVNSQFLGNPLSSLEKVISNLENTIGSLKQTTENYTQKIN